jgi:hypothetical protein
VIEPVGSEPMIAIATIHRASIGLIAQTHSMIIDRPSEIMWDTGANQVVCTKVDDASFFHDSIRNR